MRFLPMLFAVMVAACASGARAPAQARFDLGAAAIAWQTPNLPIRGVEASAPSWLGTPAMHYRLLYAGPMLRHAYAESRWAAPPAELIERALNRETPKAGGNGCVVRLDIDELAQVFDTPLSSRTLLEARARLVAPRGAVLARKAFALAQPAPTPDAHGGATAAAAAVQALGGEMGRWLAELANGDAGTASACSARWGRRQDPLRLA